MGKVQFHQKGGLIHKARKKENLLTGNMDPDKKFVYETQAIQRTAIE